MDPPINLISGLTIKRAIMNFFLLHMSKEINIFLFCMLHFIPQFYWQSTTLSRKVQTSYQLQMLENTKSYFSLPSSSTKIPFRPVDQVISVRIIPVSNIIKNRIIPDSVFLSRCLFRFEVLNMVNRNPEISFFRFATIMI